tara:strand:- start:3923 stop:4909 length:987 start_codon:yes stop_codon:yes gene_type:complete
MKKLIALLTLIPYIALAVFTKGQKLAIFPAANLNPPVSALHIDGATASAVEARFTAGSTTGMTTGDGFIVGVDSSANGVINQKESLPIILSTANAEVARINATGSIVTKVAVDLEDPGAGTNYLRLQAPTLANTWTMTLPTTPGTSNYMLTTNGSGTTTWTVQPSSGATLYGTINHAVTASCVWSYNLAGAGAGIWLSAAADTDCPTPAVTGSVTAPATKLPGFVVTSAAAGTYDVYCTGWFRFAATAADVHVLRLYDATTGTGAAGGITTVSADNTSAFYVRGQFVWSVSTTATIVVQMMSINGAGTSTINNTISGIPFYCSIMRVL